jgi:hypothetical protein
VTPQAARCHRAALRVQVSFLRFVSLYRKAGFDPDQPRDRQGRWTDTGADQADLDVSIVEVQYSFGKLIGQTPAVLGARVCFYQFSFGIVAVQGPMLGDCPGNVPSSAVTHGRLLPNPANDP